MRIDPERRDATTADYVGRVCRAIDHVLANLERPIPLEEVARVACFSPFHFHRVFRAMLGETLQQFVKRTRLERALTMLARRPERSLTEIALACGFGSLSDFSRSFKQRYGVPPSAFDVDQFRQQRREDWQVVASPPEYRHLLEGLAAGDNPDGFAVTLRDLPARRVAYIRVLDPYRPDVVRAAAEELIAWAQERGLADGQWLGYMWDDPEIVRAADCRYDVGVEVVDARPDGRVGIIEFPAMTVGELELRGGIDLEMRALDWLFKTWLPGSGYEPTDQPAFEAWFGLPFAHGLEHFELAAQLPVKRAVGH